VCSPPLLLLALLLLLPPPPLIYGRMMRIIVSIGTDTSRKVAGLSLLQHMVGPLLIAQLKVNDDDDDDEGEEEGKGKVVVVVIRRSTSNAKYLSFKSFPPRRRRPPPPPPPPPPSSPPPGLKGVLALMDQPFIRNSQGTTITDDRIFEAVKIIISYQNSDGGWATYENNRGYGWYEWLNPSEVSSS